MKILNPQVDIDKFFQSLSAARSRLLLLDYDGTLAPFKIDRDRALPYDGVTEILDDIIGADRSRVVVISGRPVADLKPLLKMRKLPEIWGSHGWEKLAENGQYTAFELDPVMSEGLNEAHIWLSEKGYRERSESKHGCLAIHWRGLAENEIIKIKDNIMKHLAPISNRSGLVIRSFDGGLELRAPKNDKGKVIKKILSAYPNAVISYLGDDNTDEDAFQALGSNGLSVLVNRHLRVTSADIWLKPPDQLVDYLNRWKVSL